MFKRTNFLYRLNSTAKVGWSSSITFATVGTALSTLVIVPGMSVLFSVLLGRDLSAPDPVRIACASALASVVLGVAVGVVARAATDRWLGVFEQVCTARRFDAAYWLGVSAMPVLLALITGITNLGVAAAYAGFGGSLDGSLSMLPSGSHGRHMSGCFRRWAGVVSLRPIPGRNYLRSASAYQCRRDRADKCIPGVAGGIVYIGSRRTNDCFGERLF